MIRTNLKIAATALAVASAFASTTYAAGFQLTEQSALALGRAYAGVGVDGTDVSGMYYNPATMTLHPGTQVQLGAVGVGLNLEYVGHDDDYKENGRAKEEVL
ncbi:MAG: transporter, partial [Sutterella sp.]|nr:transporter [Sutterella sp.]